jgi:predicted N-acyltransferase
MLGTGIEGWVLATSPLGSRGGVVCRADLGEGETQAVYDAVIAALKGVAKDERLPLCWNAIPEAAPLAEALDRAGCTKVFYVVDSELALADAGGTVDGYLKQFAHKTRLNFKSEMRSADKAGYRFEVVGSGDVAPIGDDIARSYENTYSKYGEEYFVHTAAFWTELVRSLDGNASLVVARKGDAFAGFSMLLHKGEEMFVFRVGRAPGPDGKDPPIYFSLLAWEPIRRALALGLRRVWLAGGAFEAKRHRGARARPLFSHLWFPSTRSRVIVAPFVTLYGRINWAQVSKKVHT